VQPRTTAVTLRLRLPYFLIALAIMSSLAAAQNDPSLKALYIEDDNNLYLVNAAGDERQLTSDGIPKSMPVWSRDGRRIAFLRDAPKHQSLSHLVVITDTGKAVADIPVQPVEPNSPGNMRFVEILKWLTPDRIEVGGSINPSTFEVVVFDINTGEEVDETDSDEIAPVFSLDGKHFAGFSGMPHFSDEDNKEPQLDVDNKRVYPAGHVRVDFVDLDEPVWSQDSHKLAVTAKEAKTQKFVLVIWRSDGPLVTLPLPLPWDDVKTNLVWQDNTLMVQAAQCIWRAVNATTTAPFCDGEKRAWRVADDFTSLVEISTESFGHSFEMSKQPENLHPDVWCKSCEVATGSTH